MKRIKVSQLLFKFNSTILFDYLTNQTVDISNLKEWLFCNDLEIYKNHESKTKQ